MEQKKIWDYYQTDEQASILSFGHSLPRYRYLARYIRAGESVLNIGVGLGGLERILLEKGVKVSTLDPSEKAIKRIRVSLKLGDQAKVGYSQDIPFFR